MASRGIATQLNQRQNELETLSVIQAEHRVEFGAATRKKIDRAIKQAVISRIREIPLDKWNEAREVEIARSAITTNQIKTIGMPIGGAEAGAAVMLAPLYKKLNWESMLDDFSDPMRLVHLAARMDSVAIEALRKELLVQRRAAYEDELTLQAQRVGCDRKGLLNDGVTLSKLNTESAADAASIANTFNAHLASAIERIKIDVPSANRHTYAKRLGEWEAKRRDFKSQQIMQHTEGTARALALTDFYNFNYVDGYATLLPTDAVCPICAGWINRGQVPLQEAKLNPPPYHINCPHYWETFPNKMSRQGCQSLWMGG